MAIKEDIQKKVVKKPPEEDVEEKKVEEEVQNLENWLKDEGESETSDNLPDDDKKEDIEQMTEAPPIEGKKELRTEESIDEELGLDEPIEEEEEEPRLKISKPLLLIGLLLCAAGLIGIAGLRTGLIQSLLGDPAAYPGIGHAEPTGHIVAILPIVVGLVTIFAWGVKNDPIYYEIEKQKEEKFLFEDGLEVPEELKEPLEKLEEEIEEAPFVDEPAPPEEQELEDPPVEEPLPEEQELEPPEKVEEPGPPRAPKEVEDDEQRVARCEKMLATADISLKDRERLFLLIPTGISAVDFTNEVKTAIVKKKKKEKETLTADEKAAQLEEELAEELAELEEELDEAVDEDEGDLEEKILREIEDLEDL